MPSNVRALLALALLLGAQAAPAQDSLNVTVLGRQNLYSSYSDIWGYTTTSGDELALLGTATGTSIVDVTNPAFPNEIAFISGPTSIWRDMKTHDRYAYIVTEDGNVGIQIVDLEANPSPQLVGTFDATLDQAHNIGITDGVAYAFGATQGGSSVGTRIISLANPTNPVDLGAFTTYYVHDGVVRGDTLWAACISNDLLAVVDVSNAASPNILPTFTWEGSNAHNCDLSTDGSHLFTTDESTGGDLHAFNVSDLGNVQEVASWTANPDAIIHNVLVRGDLAFIAYYTEGVRIVDIANPEFPVEVGFYDTWPGVSGGFNGAWGVYPHAPSGHIYVSDIATGLYVLDYQQAQGAVEGVVSVAGEGTTVAQAQVEILGEGVVQTNASGFYKRYADPGTYTIVISSFGFEPDTAAVQLTMGATTTHDVSLTRIPSSRLAGTVRESVGSTGLQSASIVLRDTPLTILTDANGDYEFPDVPHGVYVADVSRFGYTPASASVTVTIVDPSQSVVLDFELDPAALSEDFESGPGGWFVGGPSDDATAGFWVWSDPVGSGGGTVQPEDDHSDPGALCWVTGNAGSPNSSINAADVDGGQTTLNSPVFDLSGLANPHFRYWRWFSNDRGFAPTTADTLRVDISNNGGLDWVAVERVTVSSTWTEVTVRVADFVAPTNLMALRFIAEDAGSASTVEAAIDDLSAFDIAVTDAVPRSLGTRLLPAVPNPFNPRTRLGFEITQGGPVRLRIVDVRGRLVRELHRGVLPAGTHARPWDGLDTRGRSVASGSYWVQLQAHGSTQSRRIVLLK